MIELRYQLQPKEIEETLLCLAYKREGRFKQFNLAVLTVFAFVGILGYVRNSDHQIYLIFSAVCICFLFILLYLQPFLRLRKAKKIARMKGYYDIIVKEEGLITKERKEKQVWETQRMQVLVSENVISIQLNGNVYCIPNRILIQSQRDEILTILRNYCVVRQVRTGRRI